MTAPTISIGIDKESDGMFTVKLLMTGLVSFSQAQVAANYMQGLFCGEEIQLADGGKSQEEEK